MALEVREGGSAVVTFEGSGQYDLDVIERGEYGQASFPTLRAFQVETIENLRAGWREGHRCQVVMAATGSGKTLIGLKIIHDALMKGRSAMFVCDRTTLIDQTSAVADRYGLSDHGIIQADHWRIRRSRFQIASAQTLAKRGWPDVDVIVCDEAHTLYKTITDHITGCRAGVIGLSATPFTKGMGKLYTNLVNAATMDELTRSGVLVPMRVGTCSKIDMKGAKTAGGEWTDKAAEERGLAVIGDVVTEWSKFGEGRKTIVFGATIAHCEALTRQFNEAGISAATFTADTTKAERDLLLAEYRKADSQLRVLISVEALAKGFDVPDVGCICDCRPLRKSLSTAIQMWGRGLRSHPEKKDLILLDFSGNIVRFADDFAQVYFEGLDKLDNGEALDKSIRTEDEEKPEGKPCPNCGYKPCGRRCVACGHRVEKVNLIEHLPGEMQEFTIGKKNVGGKMDVWAQAVTICRYSGKPETAAQRAAHLYRSVVGVWPRGLPDYHSTQDVAVSQAMKNKQRANMIAYRSALGK